MVNKKEITVVVADASNTLGEALKKVVTEAHKATEDGFQPAQDVSAIGAACFMDVIEAVKKIKDLGPEFKEEQAAAIKGLLIPIVDAVEVVVKK